jgi:hypothetical protein
MSTETGNQLAPTGVSLKPEFVVVVALVLVVQLADGPSDEGVVECIRPFALVVLGGFIEYWADILAIPCPRTLPVDRVLGLDLVLCFLF